LAHARAGLKPFPEEVSYIRHEEVETLAEMLHQWAKK
jgi:hypothetical protein